MTTPTKYQKVQVDVIDADTVRFGGSAFKRERTCHWKGLEEWKNPVECSECGVLVVAHVALDSNYCPHCGAKVEQ